jgi:hypothetical protein
MNRPDPFGAILSFMAERSFAILLEHRPRRIAFLVDLGQEGAHEMLAGILRFNLSTWGGRHNPIVPLFNKVVPESFYSLLDVADPDIFYVFGELESRELGEIHQLYSPTLVIQHHLREPIDEHTYGVQLREQATIDKYLTNLRDKQPPYFRRSPEPCVLQLQIGEERNLSPFFMWNFGYTTSNFFAIQNHNVPGCQPASISDHDLLELLTKQMNLAWPIHVCGDAPIARTAGDSWRHDFHVFYGSSLVNVVAYWNDALTTGRTSPLGEGIRQLWLTPAVMNVEATYKSLIGLLRLRVRSTNHQTGLRMLSCDASPEELEAVGKKIVQDVRGTLYYGGSINFGSSDLAAPVQPRKITRFFSRRSEIEYATGTEIHLAPTHPPDIEEESDQCWMVDTHIYNPAQKLWYSNAEPWWCLPRNPSIAGIFTRRPHRMIFDHRVSFEVSARDSTLDFETPSDEKLFRYLLSPRVHYHLAGDLRAGLKGSKHDVIQFSDKGRYLSGILGLFETLPDALHFFEHPFWRSLVEKFSHKRPSKYLVEKLASDVRQLLGNAHSQKEAESWLTDELIFASRGMSRAPVWLGLNAIQDLHTEYIAGLDPEQQRFVTRDVTSGLSELTSDSVIFQGVALRCPNCMSSYWYSIEDMHRTISCRGCYVSFPLPAETPWSYQLNELIRAGVADQGLLPVFRTLARLFDGANDCFFFTPSVEFLTYADGDKLKLERELDIGWIKDGSFGIAEIKTTSKLFKQSDFEDLVTLASAVRPDIVLIATPEGSTKELLTGKKMIEEKLNKNTRVWAWGAEEFEHSPSWTKW